MGTCASCKRKSTATEDVILVKSCEQSKDLDKLTNNNTTDKVDDSTKLILVKNSENTDSLPIKKRYKYEVNDLQDILAGQAYLKKLSNEDIGSKSISMSNISDKNSSIYGTPHHRSRSYSPGKESKRSDASRKSSSISRKRSKTSLDRDNEKLSVSFDPTSQENNKEIHNTCEGLTFIAK